MLKKCCCVEEIIYNEYEYISRQETLKRENVSQ